MWFNSIFAQIIVRQSLLCLLLLSGKASFLACLHAFLCKNVLYKNVEAEICRKFKNVRRMFRGSNSNQHRNLSMNSHRIWWCLLLMLDFYLKRTLNTALYTSRYHYRCIKIHIPLSICCLYLQTEIGSPSILFAVHIHTQEN